MIRATLYWAQQEVTAVPHNLSHWQAKTWKVKRFIKRLRESVSPDASGQHHTTADFEYHSFSSLEILTDTFSE